MRRLVEYFNVLVVCFALLLIGTSCSQAQSELRQVRIIAKAFHERRLASFIAPFQYTRVVKSSGKCIHFQAISGFSEVDGQNHATFYSTDVLISGLHNPEDGKEMSPWRVIPSTKRSSLKSYFVGYDNYVRPQLWDRLYILENYSPLHPRRTKMYSYSIRDTVLQRGEQGHIIIFQSKNEKKSRIIGKGYIIVDQGWNPIRITVSDAILFVGGRQDDSMPTLISPYQLSFDYQSFEGFLYVSRATLSVKWVIPNDSNVICWCIEGNPVGNPFMHKIETETELLFGSPNFSFSVVKELRKYPILQNFTYYTDTVNIAKWRSRVGASLDIWMQDLSYNDEELEKQTREICTRYKQQFEKATGQNYEHLYKKMELAQSVLF